LTLPVQSVLAAALAGAVLSTSAADRLSTRANYGSTALSPELRLDQPVQASGSIRNRRSVLDPSLKGASGRKQVVVRLKRGATASLGPGEAALRQDRKFQIENDQARFIGRIEGKGSIRVLGRTQHVLNAVFLDVPARALRVLARDPDVMRIAPVGHYQLDLSETVPYIGGSAAQALGFDGEGVSVAVLDSGVDYTHADLGGSGDPADYAANDGTIIEPGTFPTDKVVGGFDFLGNVWPLGPGGFDDPPLPDPDPLDDLALEPGAFAGHGTHVADIIGGANGVAPGADIYAVKVCASLSSSCNGISLILGMEFSVDPDGDGDTSDHVDIINMSLGANYGQPFDDDLSAAVDNATAIGSLTVASAGNSGDSPYITGTPSAAPTAIGVAQTNVPSAQLFGMQVIEPAAEAGIKDAVKYDWTPDPTERIEGPVNYAVDSAGNLDGCAPFDTDLTGQIVAVDRGGCFFSTKIQNIEAAGGALGIVMLIAPGAPFAGGFGEGDFPTIPGFNISQADGDILRAGDAVVAFGPDLTTSLAGVTVSSSSRGPDGFANSIKPELGAPGASVSADVATGVGRAPFGGTSGAAPMVSGSAALVLDACRERGDDCTPLELKALLMNTAFRDMISDTTGERSEITRTGAGEVRVDAAVEAEFVAWSTDDDQPSLSLGFNDVTRTTTIKRNVTVQNLSDRTLRIGATTNFRDGADLSSGAVSVKLGRKPRQDVPAGKTRNFQVSFTIDPSKLSGNPMNSGFSGTDAATLTAAEYDGFLVLTEALGGEAALPWHIIPRQAAEVEPDRTTIVPGGLDTIALQNRGAGVAQLDAYTLVGLSDEIPRGIKGGQSPTPDLRAFGYTTVDFGCAAGFGFAFAVNTWDRQTHLLPVVHELAIDTDQDGATDYFVFNAPFSLILGDGSLNDARELTYVEDVAAETAGAFFFAEHATNTGNTVLRVCGEQLGLTADDLMVTNMDVTVRATDFYFGGPGDEISGITIAPLGERYFGVPSADLPARGFGALDITDFGAFPGNSEELGVLLITNGDRGAGASGGATEDTEALLFLAPGVEPPAPL
jgi:subtilisin family serine protease